MNRFDDVLMEIATKILKAGSFNPILNQNAGSFNQILSQNVGIFHTSGRTGIARDNGFHQFIVLKSGGIPFLLGRKILFI